MFSSPNPFASPLGMFFCASAGKHLPLGVHCPPVTHGAVPNPSCPIDTTYFCPAAQSCLPVGTPCVAMPFPAHSHYNPAPNPMCGAGTKLCGNACIASELACGGIDCDFSLPYVCSSMVDNAGELLDGVQGLGEGGQVMGCKILGVPPNKPACIAATTSFCAANGGQVMPMGCDRAEPASAMDLTARSALPVLGRFPATAAAMTPDVTGWAAYPGVAQQASQPQALPTHHPMTSAAPMTTTSAAPYAVDGMTVKNKTNHKVHSVTVSGAPGTARVYAPKALKKNSATTLDMGGGRPWFSPSDVHIGVDGPDTKSTGMASLRNMDSNDLSELPYTPISTDGRHRVTVAAKKDKKKSKKMGMTVYVLVIELH